MDEEKDMKCTFENFAKCDFSELNIGKVFPLEIHTFKTFHQKRKRHQPDLLEIEFHQEPFLLQYAVCVCTDETPKAAHD